MFTCQPDQAAPRPHSRMENNIISGQKQVEATHGERNIFRQEQEQEHALLDNKHCACCDKPPY
jgi:hypothetical protein